MSVSVPTSKTTSGLNLVLLALILSVLPFYLQAQITQEHTGVLSVTDGNSYSATALGPNGALCAAWKYDDTLNVGVWTGTSWETEMILSTTLVNASTSLSDNVDLVVDSAGVFHMACRWGTINGGSPGARGVLYVRYDGNWSYSIVESMTHPGGYHGCRNPSIDLSPSGNPEIVYERTSAETGTGFQRFNHAVWNGSGWTITPHQSTIRSSHYDVAYPKLKIDANGKRHVSYMKNYQGDSHDDLWYATDKSGSWVYSVVNPGTPSVDNAEPNDLVLDNNGNPYIANDEDGTGQDIMIYANTGSGFSAIDPGVSNDAAYPSFAINANNHMAMLYQNSNDMLMVAYNVGAGWVSQSIAGPLSSTPGDKKSIAINDNDQIVVLYHNKVTNDDRRVQYYIGTLPGGGGTPPPPSNTAPTLTSHTTSTNEDQTLFLGAPIGLNMYNDADNDTMRAFTLFSLPATGHLEINGNANVAINTEYTFNDFIGLSYVPAPNASGTVTLSVNLSDGTEYAAAPATLTINVNPVNDAPVITDVQAVHQEDVPGSMLTGFSPGVYSDIEGDTAQWFKVVTLPVNGTLTLNSQPINAGDEMSLADAINAVYTPSAEFFGADSYTFNISDGTDYAANNATVFITVTEVSDAPTDISLTNTSLDENMPAGTVIGTLSATDIDPADSHTFQVNGGNGLFAVNGSQLIATGSFNYEITTGVSVDITATDLAGESYTKTFNITINDVNDAPSDIQLSNNTIDETTTVNSFVGILSASDEDATFTHTYSLVAGNGDEGNHAFVINNNVLQTNTTFNYNTQQAYSIRVRVTDDGGATYEKVFVINITDVNNAPTDIVLSANTVLENEVVGTLIGSFTTTDADQAETFTYTLANGVGGVDNGSFSITGDKLYTSTVFDFETKNTYSILVRVQDGSGNNFTKAFNIAVQDVNEAPTLLGLSNNTVAENLPAGTVVGSFMTTDVDAQDSHTYSLVTGTGSTGNSSFGIQGTQLVTNASFDYEAQDTYSIRVKSVDGAGNSVEEVFTINIADGNDAPVGVTLDVLSIDENSPMGATIGTLSAVDPDPTGQHTYTLVSGAGSNDNASFSIVANKLQVNHSYDYETKNSYLVRVRATDQSGDWTEESFAIDINDVNEAPTLVNAQTITISENMPAGTVVAQLNTSDEDNGDSHTYDLVVGNGDADNSLFAISGNNIVTTGGLNYESQANYSVRVEASDRGGLKKATLVQINIVDANDAPVAADMSKTTSANTSVTIFSRELTNSWSDEDGDAYVKITIQSIPSYGTVYNKTTALQVGDVISVGDIAYLKYVPTQHFAGTDRFSYQVSDGMDYSNIAYVNITVNMGRVAGPGANVGNASGLNGLIFNREAGTETGIEAVSAENATLNNFPNPFQGNTTITYTLPGEYQVSIKVYDLLGKEVSILVNDLQPAGENKVQWNGTDLNGQDLSSGKYICQMILADETGALVSVKTISLMKVK